MTYTESTAQLVDVARSGDVTTTRLLASEAVSEPLAPAGLYAGPDAPDEVWQLHKLVEREADGSLVFETYGSGPPPQAGERFVFRPWWTPGQLAIAADRTLDWRREQYAKGDHEHCLLTWETILPGATAYHSTAGWLATAAYERFIRDDLLRLREPS
ncbi:MAG TPA: hypothetical protein VK488_12990 [Gaiellaceae bacterium]|nr:hypothetical protein [Gaiellaceae bacterium]